MRRLAPVLLLALVILPTVLRTADRRAVVLRRCRPEGRGTPPRHWLGCAGDPGPARPLADEERLALRLPLDPNRAGARALAFVPGLSRRLAEQLVEDRERRGPFTSVDGLRRVRGIGPVRLERARPWLGLEPSVAPPDRPE